MINDNNRPVIDGQYDWVRNVGCSGNFGITVAHACNSDHSICYPEEGV